MELKVRVWDPKKKSMTFYFTGEAFYYEEYEHVMLHIGVKDSEGNEIYLHDIMECAELDDYGKCNKRIHLVMYFSRINLSAFDVGNEVQIWPRSVGGKYINNIQYFLADIKGRSLKVIGNKFENPELLK